MVAVELLYPKGDNDTNHDNSDADHDNDDGDDDFALLRFVVTAAHCIEGDAYGWEVSIKNRASQK